MKKICWDEIQRSWEEDSKVSWIVTAFNHKKLAFQEFANKEIITKHITFFSSHLETEKPSETQSFLDFDILLVHAYRVNIINPNFKRLTVSVKPII